MKQFFIGLLVTIFLLGPATVLAADTLIDYMPLETVPGLTTVGQKVDPVKYVQGIFTVGISIAAVIAVLMIVWAGFQYVTLEKVSSKEDAKNRVTHAFYGLGLALASFLILHTINPQLVEVDLDLRPRGTNLRSLIDQKKKDIIEQNEKIALETQKAMTLNNQLKLRAEELYGEAARLKAESDALATTSPRHLELKAQAQAKLDEANRINSQHLGNDANIHINAMYTQGINVLKTGDLEAGPVNAERVLAAMKLNLSNIEQLKTLGKTTEADQISDNYYFKYHTLDKEIKVYKALKTNSLDAWPQTPDHGKIQYLKTLKELEEFDSSSVLKDPEAIGKYIVENQKRLDELKAKVNCTGKTAKECASMAGITENQLK